ncbi:hypothetical protein ANN_04321 [Periplaneta americana]|uniref:Uncharacterized protein n=1 Tax=Periplaneta americana TaxID=6978 RepID=A0ABQ8TA51_PERAM|nr:hypothetical protein ANN_04321 [Periplaneta americana]
MTASPKRLWEIDLVAEAKKRRLHYLGHVVRMEEERVPKKTLDQHLEGRRKQGRPRKSQWTASQPVLCSSEASFETGVRRNCVGAGSPVFECSGPQLGDLSSKFSGLSLKVLDSVSGDVSGSPPLPIELQQDSNFADLRRQVRSWLGIPEDDEIVMKLRRTDGTLVTLSSLLIGSSENEECPLNLTRGDRQYFKEAKVVGANPATEEGSEIPDRTLAIFLISHQLEFLCIFFANFEVTALLTSPGISPRLFSVLHNISIAFTGVSSLNSNEDIIA